MERTLKTFIDQLSPDNYGINYDIGNSAAMGFDPKEEIQVYGQRILNVHIKPTESPHTNSASANPLVDMSK